MAILVAHFKLLPKITHSQTFLSLRPCCNLSKIIVSKPAHTPIKATSETVCQYYTAIQKELQSPEKYNKKTGKQPKYAYDVNLNVPDNVLLYTDGNRRHFYGLMQVLSVGAFLAFMLIGDTIRVVLRQLKATPPPEGEQIKWYQWWKRLTPGGKTTGNVVFYLISAAGLILCFFGHLFPARMICTIWLLRGGRTVSMSTYQSLGRIKTRKYPLKDISCEGDPSAVERFIPFKVKGKYLYFLMDKKKGTFYNEPLFKGCLALKRQL